MLDFSPLAGSAGGTPLVVLLAVLILCLIRAESINEFFIQRYLQL